MHKEPEAPTLTYTCRWLTHENLNVGMHLCIPAQHTHKPASCGQQWEQEKSVDCRTPAETILICTCTRTNIPVAANRRGRKEFQLPYTRSTHTYTYTRTNTPVAANKRERIECQLPYIVVPILTHAYIHKHTSCGQ